MREKEPWLTVRAPGTWWRPSRVSTSPPTKDTLIEEASRKGAPPDVVKALRGIPAEQYANREEVARNQTGAGPGRPRCGRRPSRRRLRASPPESTRTPRAASSADRLVG
ncbi:DUF2795 domain-containing protein [Streptomyces sp. NPDC096191]|uniref:DUF2795 domain-containing protein n=1 Tax=Streptomyces sp. NPDC096191 TaxID=3155426 RepID=UPI00331B4E1A